MPDGIVGSNDGFFGNFLLGYNPNADIYINNSNLNAFIQGASPANSGNVNLSLRSLGVGENTINLYTQGAFIGSGLLNISTEGFIPNSSNNLNISLDGSTSNKYNYSKNNINFYINGKKRSSEDSLNIYLNSSMTDLKNDSINITIDNPESKYNKKADINLSILSEIIKYEETLNLSIQNTGNITSDNVNISVFGYPIKETGINMSISGALPNQSNSYMNMMIQGPKNNATGLNLTIKPSLLMDNYVNINIIGGR
jgi:hypothetical protein